MIKNMIDEIGVMMIDTPYIVSLRSKKAHLSNSDKKRLLKKLIHFREMNANEIINIIKIYAIWEPDEAIYEARKKGVFRYRAHGFHGNVVLNVLNELILCQSMFNFSEETYSFLERKISLCWLYDYYALTEKRLIKYIKKSHKNRKRIIRNRYHVETALFKELLVYIDVMFGNLDHAHDNDAIMAHLHKNSLDDYGQEEISLAISYIIFLYEKVIGIKQDVVYFVDTKKIKSREMDSYILEACKLIEMEEWELAIDYFDYSANFNGNEWVIEDDGSNMEKSIRAGYVQRYSQEHIYNIRNKDIEAIKMGDISASVKENLADKILEKVNDGELTRYRFRIPKLIFSYFSTENHTMLFHEEIMQIGYFARELCMDFDELCNKKITKNCTLLDLVLFKRFFSLMGYIISEFLTEKKDESETVYLSLIPGISEKTLLGYANIFVNDIEKSKELLDLLVFNSATKLDLQYTPMIRASSTLLHPNFLFISSNLLRNVIAHSYYVKNQYPNDDGGLESLVSICEKEFTECKHGYQVFANRKFKYSGQQGEVDLIVVCDEDIILIECKCPLSPCNNFEMRSSLDHIAKAGRQLDLSKKAFEDTNFRKNFFCNNLKIKDNEQSIQTCIVFGNRLFSGYMGAGHPIRHIYELGNILNNGTIPVYYDNELVYIHKIWEKELYSHNDLLNFLSEDKSLVKLRLKNLQPIKKHLHVMGRYVTFNTYVSTIPSRIENVSDVEETYQDYFHSLQE